MANSTDSLDTQKQAILSFLSDDNVKTIVLFGEAGVGKTWMAKEISNSASLKGSSYGTIWVAPGYNCEGRSLLEYIAIQLSVFSSNEELEEDDNAEMEQQERKVDPEYLKQEIWKKLDLMKPELEAMKTAKSEEKKPGKLEPKAPEKVNQKDAPGAGKDPYLLVVLDGINVQENILAQLVDILSHHWHCRKVLITRRGSDNGIGNEGNGDTIQTDNSRSREIKFLSHVESLNLLQNRVKVEVSRATGFGRLSAALGKCSAGHPGAIIIIAEALNHVKDSELESAVEKVASIMESSDINTTLQHVYEMLPSNLNKCCWHCRYLFVHHDGIHYNELITQWLLEGYFDDHDNIEKAYEDAHRTLMELKDRGFLREREYSHVYMESDALGVTDHRHDGLSEACIGVASVLKDQTWAGFGRVIQTDGMVKTGHGKRSDMSTVLMDGARFCRETPKLLGAPETFFQQLKVLVILNPMFKKLPSPLSKLTKLQILVLRGCRLLESIDEIDGLVNLLVLEISGACLLKEIREDLFEPMKDLRSLNLSEVGINWLPTSVLNRRELRWLILRKCPNLERLCNPYLLKKKEEAKQEVLSLAKLEVLDFSGSESFQNIQVRTLNPLQKLQILNLSKTKIGRLPFFHNLGELTRLLLSDCASLARLPTLRPLTKLEILVLSRTKYLKEVQDDSQETKTKFRVLDVTGSAVNKLPSNINGLSHFFLSGCDCLLKLPSTQNLKGLKELDLSDAYMLEGFEDDSFGHLISLRRLILSNTKIKALPSLPEHSELRFLLLKNCKCLTELQNLSKLQKLEVLDLSGCSELAISSNDSFQGMSHLKTINPYSFQGMPHLKTINLSETKIESFPPDCFPISLCELIITKCPNLKVPSLEDLSNLEVLDLHGAESLSELEFLGHMSKLRILDLSEIKFGKLPSLSHLTNLRALHLRRCSCEVSKLDDLKKLELLDLSGTKVGPVLCLKSFSNLQQLLLGNCADLEDLKDLKSLTNLEVLDLSRTKVKEYPYKISDLTSLRKLNLEDMEHMKEIDWKQITYIPEEFNLRGCGSLSSENFASPEWPSISICGTGFLQFVGENSKLWDTCFQKFHFCVWLPKNEDGRTYDLGDWGLLTDIKSQGRIPHHEELGRYLEIHGSYCKSSLPESVLEHANHISLIDDSSFSHLSELVKEKLKSIKSCWLERCISIKSIVDRQEDARASGKLEFLYLCNLSSLRCICDDKVQVEVFGGLKSLYVECCPMLTDIFPLSKLPKKLETLRIKFCDEMRELFDHGVSAECNLQTLDLMELPKLEKIGVMMVSLRVLKVRRCPILKNLCPLSDLPKKLRTLQIKSCDEMKELFSPGMAAECNLQTLDLMELNKLEKIGVMMVSLRVLKVGRCPYLENLEEVLGEAENLETLHISHAARLKTICNREVKPTSFKKLKQLKIESCPQLKEVSPSSELPQNLEVLEIDSCETLETIFVGSSAGSSLSRVRLRCLPKLSSSGFIVLPRYDVSSCPNLQIDRSG